MKKKILFSKSLAGLPSGVFDLENTLLIYDKHLLRVSSEFRAWSKKFPHRYGARSGESIKELSDFAQHAEKLAQLAKSISPRSLTVLSAGGGSIGDFAGFFASVYKRGVRLVHMPTTWLAAIDSSHGGKTALNSGGAKNQFGTFYPADQVVVVRSVLAKQPTDRVQDAMGEFGKIALLQGGSLFRQISESRLDGEDLLWKFLEPAIDAKLKIVARDPREQNGYRQVLNFGHTVGHIFEAALGWSHGRSVGQGLFFALDFSLERGLLPPAQYERSCDLLSLKLGIADKIIDGDGGVGADGFNFRKVHNNRDSKIQSQGKKTISVRLFEKLLMSDKKRNNGKKITFVFLARVGQPQRLQVHASEIVAEARRQGLLK